MTREIYFLCRRCVMKIPHQEQHAEMKAILMIVNPGLKIEDLAANPRYVLFFYIYSLITQTKFNISKSLKILIKQLLLLFLHL